MLDQKLVLKLLSPQGLLQEIECDSVKLCIADDKNGKGAGSYGIRKGHAKAFFCLSKGKIEALDGGGTLVSKDIEGGFASVENDVVTVVADSVN